MNDQSHNNPLIVFKYGGNAMTNEALKEVVLRNMFELTSKGYEVVIVHGGGPFIQKVLDDAGIESTFVAGHRKTTAEALPYVEMALKGLVNGSIVGIANKHGYKAVGLSGKDGRIGVATRRIHRSEIDGQSTDMDLGQVGDVSEIDPFLIRIILDQGYIPILTCIVPGKNGEEYNVNADMFAGEIAGALKADMYVVLTDVDGLMKDKDDPETLISSLHTNDIDTLVEQGIVQGGMIPKIEACRIALVKGAQVARIINGTKPEYIAELQNDKTGTSIHK